MVRCDVTSVIPLRQFTGFPNYNRLQLNTGTVDGYSPSYVGIRTMLNK